MKNIILKTLCVINALVFIISLCLVDSDSYVFVVLCIVTMMYLGLFAYANKERM